MQAIEIGEKVCNELRSERDYVIAIEIGKRECKQLSCRESPRD